jgi:hypothetical protein
MRVTLCLIMQMSWILGVTGGTSGAQAQTWVPAATVPADLWWARLLLAEVAPQDNSYGTNPTIVRWAGVAGALRAVNRSVCSTFVDRVVEQAYGYSARQVTAWLGRYARTIHAAIARRRGFVPIPTVQAIKPGDIMAIEYYDDDRPSTGHVLIVDQKPRPLHAIAPIIPNTWQFEVAVIDSATSGHGPTDTRAEPSGRWHPGVGRGLFRIYVDAAGHIAGYSWSTEAGSRFYAPSVRNALVGRLALVRRGTSQPRE